MRESLWWIHVCVGSSLLSCIPIVHATNSSTLDIGGMFCRNGTRHWHVLTNIFPPWDKEGAAMVMREDIFSSMQLGIKTLWGWENLSLQQGRCREFGAHTGLSDPVTLIINHQHEFYRGRGGFRLVFPQWQPLLFMDSHLHVLVSSCFLLLVEKMHTLIYSYVFIAS